MRITFRKQLLWLISVAALAVASASFASVFGPQSEKKSPASSFDETMLPGPDIITGASLVALPNRPVRIARIGGYLFSISPLDIFRFLFVLVLYRKLPKNSSLFPYISLKI